MQIEKEYWHISRLTHFCWCLSVFREMSQSYSSRVWRLSEVPLLFLRLTETHNDLTWERRNPSSSIQYQCQDLNDSNSISRCLKPSSTCKRHEFRRQTREKRSTLGHFFPLSNVYVNSLALGRNEVRAPKECVSGNKHQQIPSSSDSLLCSCKLAYAHKRTFSLRPPLPLQGPNWRLGKKMAALWPTVLPPASSSGRWRNKVCALTPPATLPSSHGVCPSPPASITFEDKKRPESNTGKRSARNVPALNRTNLKTMNEKVETEGWKHENAAHVVDKKR